MKVLFLDHYGVLCLNPKEIIRTEHSMPDTKELNDTGITYFSSFDKTAIETLNNIIDITDAEIVISSDWKRQINLEDMCKFYKNQGIKKMPIDYTEWFPGNYTYHKQRSIEINSWINTHSEITKWVAIDDLYMGTWLKNFIWTKNVHLGINDLTIKQQLLEYLL